MTDQITLEEVFQLVSFIKDNDGKWCVGIVHGNVYGGVGGNVYGGVGGKVWGTISGKEWTSVETPREKLSRLIEEKGDQELIEAFNQLEDSND
jgi:hypothetical protein